MEHDLIICAWTSDEPSLAMARERDAPDVVTTEYDTLLDTRVMMVCEHTGSAPLML